MSKKMGRWWTHDDMSRAITPIYRGPHVSVPMRAHEVIAEHNALADRCERAEAELAAERAKVKALEAELKDARKQLASVLLTESTHACGARN